MLAGEDSDYADMLLRKETGWHVFARLRSLVKNEGRSKTSCSEICPSIWKGELN